MSRRTLSNEIWQKGTSAKRGRFSDVKRYLCKGIGIGRLDLCSIGQAGLGTIGGINQSGARSLRDNIHIKRLIMKTAFNAYRRKRINDPSDRVDIG